MFNVCQTWLGERLPRLKRRALGEREGKKGGGKVKAAKVLYSTLQRERRGEGGGFIKQFLASQAAKYTEREGERKRGMKQQQQQRHLQRQTTDCNSSSSEFVVLARYSGCAAAARLTFAYCQSKCRFCGERESTRK